MKKYITETSEDYSLIDNHTGEIIDLKQTRQVDIDTFILVFFASFPEIMKLKGVALRVLMCCWKNSTYNPAAGSEGNMVFNGPSFKENCRLDGLETSDANIDNAFSILTKKGFLFRKHKGEYMLNPEYFFKGRLSDRSKLKCNFFVDPNQP